MLFCAPVFEILATPLVMTIICWRWIGKKAKPS